MPRALAWEAWARHNTRLGFKNAVDVALDTLSDPRFRAFILVGIYAYIMVNGTITANRTETGAAGREQRTNRQRPCSSTCARLRSRPG